MTPIEIGTAASAAASWAAFGISWFRGHQRGTADYANAAFSAWEALAKRQEIREAELLSEIGKLRREVTLLRRCLVRNGIQVPDGDDE